MSDTKVTDIGTMKAGSFIVLDGVACRVSDITVSKSGKHGHAKYRMVAIGLIDDKKREVVMPSGSMVESPIIDKCVAQVLSVTDDNANVMDSESFETLDLKIPEELKGQVREGVSIIYWTILNDKIMKQIKSE
jgi:translation initiation factor 5A